METANKKYDPKKVLLDIMNAFCLSSVNLDKVYKLSGIKARLYNGKRSNEQLRKVLLRAISNEKAKEIINQMPFPYIETADKIFEKQERDCHWFIENTLTEIPKKRGNKIECPTSNYSIYYK
jgi:hypothetical protein